MTTPRGRGGSGKYGQQYGQQQYDGRGGKVVASSSSSSSFPTTTTTTMASYKDMLSAPGAAGSAALMNLAASSAMVVEAVEVNPNRVGVDYSSVMSSSSSSSPSFAAGNSSGFGNGSGSGGVGFGGASFASSGYITNVNPRVGHQQQQQQQQQHSGGRGGHRGGSRGGQGNNNQLPIAAFAKLEVPEAKIISNDLEITSSDYYADSYAHYGIHEEMLQDDVRTVSYMNAITRNPHLFQGKVVLDVGCGTGILSMFAARAGARLVIGVDMSSIAEQAKQIIKANKLESVVKIIRGKIEDIELPPEVGPEGKVDIIVSEWMGYFLLYESMLDSVLFARDKFLKRDGTGMLFPDRASMFICGIEDADYRQRRLNFWDSVYGFDMSCIKEMVLSEALIDSVDEKSVMTSTYKLIEFDLNTVTKEELDFEVPFSLQAYRQDFCHGFTVYFDVIFSKCHSPVYFSTKPSAPYTHWKQTTFWLREVLTVCEREMIRGVLKCTRNARNPRDLDIELGCSFQGRLQSVNPDSLSIPRWRYRVR